MQLETLGFNAPGTADVEQARATLLSTEGATCVAVRNGEMVISCERGVKHCSNGFPRGAVLRAGLLPIRLWARRRRFCMSS